MSQQFIVSWFRSARDAHASTVSTTWPRLVNALTTFHVYDRLPWSCTTKGCKGAHEPGPEHPCPVCGGAMELDKRSTRAWSPCRFEGRRSLACARELSCLVLDYDDGTPISVAHDTWCGWPHVLHTSWSHTVAHPKFRVVLPFESPVPAEGWSRVWAWALARAPQIDRKCKDSARLYFLPAVRAEDWPRDTLVWDEPSRLLALDWRRLPPTADEPSAVQRPTDRPVNRRYASHEAQREAQRRMKEDPDVRARVGRHLGGRVVEGPAGRVDGVTCPKCNKPSVWWPLAPHRSPKAMCHHRNTCGWMGWLDELLPGAAA